MFLAKIIVTLKKSILDPQGKAVHHALISLNMSSIEDIRMGKFFEMKINCSDLTEAADIAEEACKKLLTNPIMENYSFTLEKIKEN